MRPRWRPVLYIVHYLWALIKSGALCGEGGAIWDAYTSLILLWKASKQAGMVSAPDRVNQCYWPAPYYLISLSPTIVLAM